jgi:hypothetical protein
LRWSPIVTTSPSNSIRRFKVTNCDLKFLDTVERKIMRPLLPD